jgi:hypothetical protein
LFLAAERRRHRDELAAGAAAAAALALAFAARPRPQTSTRRNPEAYPVLGAMELVRMGAGGATKAQVGLNKGLG